jgi:hypothetical protein
MTLVSGELRIRPVRVQENEGGSVWLKELYDRFAPVRQEATRFSEDEINADINQAFAEVRKQRG